MKVKVLIADDAGDIHFIEGPLLKATRSLCGKRLHSIETTRVRDKHAVSCTKCKEAQEQQRGYRPKLKEVLVVVGLLGTLIVGVIAFMKLLHYT